MRNLRELDHIRDVGNELRIYGKVGDSLNGLFMVYGLCIIATSDYGWDHVSVSHSDRTPTWEEMEKIKRLFFKDDEAAFQLHVPVNEYIDGNVLGRRAQYCLHIWRPLDKEIPRPPDWLVGNKIQVEEFKKGLHPTPKTTTQD
jgi:hypothetical protein